MSDTAKRTIVTANEFQLVDNEGKLRAKLSSDNDEVTLSLMTSKGQANLKITVDEKGMSSLRLFDGESGKQRIDISVDEKGTHLYLAGKNKQQSYLFLKNDGPSGVVLIDQEGSRRAEMLVNQYGEPQMTVYPTEEEYRNL